MKVASRVQYSYQFMILYNFEIFLYLMNCQVLKKIQFNKKHFSEPYTRFLFDIFKKHFSYFAIRFSFISLLPGFSVVHLQFMYKIIREVQNNQKKNLVKFKNGFCENTMKFVNFQNINRSTNEILDENKWHLMYRRGRQINR
eukprot:NP_491717.1 Uncharacterized protein CELE_B0207.8 [Caenorhabditis elegans]